MFAERSWQTISFRLQTCQQFDWAVFEYSRPSIVECERIGHFKTCQIITHKLLEAAGRTLMVSSLHPQSLMDIEVNLIYANSVFLMQWIWDDMRVTRSRSEPVTKQTMSSHTTVCCGCWIKMPQLCLTVEHKVVQETQLLLYLPDKECRYSGPWHSGTLQSHSVCMKCLQSHLGTLREDKGCT